MSYVGFGSGLRMPQQVRHKVFLSYHHSGDQAYYNAFSKAFHETHEAIYDNSLERKIDSDDVDYVMRRIRENFIIGTSCTIVLIGKDSWGRKYLDWEIMASLDKGHGLIGVQLPSAPVTAENKVTVPLRLQDNIQSGFALWLNWAQITAGRAQLDQYIADAKTRSTRLIVNNRDRCLRNA